MGASDVYQVNDMFWGTRERDVLPSALVLDRNLKIVDKPDFGQEPGKIKDFWRHVLKKAVKKI